MNLPGPRDEPVVLAFLVLRVLAAVAHHFGVTLDQETTDGVLLVAALVARHFVSPIVPPPVTNNA